MPTVAELFAVLQTARKAHDKTGRAVSRAYKAWEKAARAEREAVPMGIAEALESHLLTEERRLDNAQGRALLDWVNEWTRPRGLMFGSHFYTTTGQRAVQVMLNYRMSQEHLAYVAEMIEALLPSIKPGGLKSESWGRKPKPHARDAWKAFDIFENSCSADGDFRLAFRDDGVWAVYDARRFGYSSGEQSMAEGDLMHCLEFIREHLWYGGGVRNDYDGFGL